MTTLSVNNPTLLDLAKRSDPDGKITSNIVEILNLTNPVLDDMTWLEGNLPTGHRTTIRTGIPVPTWRKLYGGVQPTKSNTAQVTDNTGMLEAYAEIDKALADLNGNTAAWRLSEEMPHIEGIAQTIAKTIFYGNEGTLPESFTGLSPRYNSTTAGNGANVIKAATSGSSLRSIYLVVWGPNTVHGIVPKGSKAGLQVKDLGEVTIENQDGAGGRMQAYRSHYRFDAGLTVRDWRYIVRIANIDPTTLTKDAATGADLRDLMFQAMSIVPNLSVGRPVFYASRDVWTFLRRQTAAATKQSTLSAENVGGQFVENFHGIPIKRVDALNTDETLVV